MDFFRLQVSGRAATELSAMSEPSRISVPGPGGPQSDQSVQVSLQACEPSVGGVSRQASHGSHDHTGNLRRLHGRLCTI